MIDAITYRSGTPRHRQGQWSTTTTTYDYDYTPWLKIGNRCETPVCFALRTWMREESWIHHTRMYSKRTIRDLLYSMMRENTPHADTTCSPRRSTTLNLILRKYLFASTPLPRDVSAWRRSGLITKNSSRWSILSFNETAFPDKWCLSWLPVLDIGEGRGFRRTQYITIYLFMWSVVIAIFKLTFINFPFMRFLVVIAKAMSLTFCRRNGSTLYSRRVKRIRTDKRHICCDRFMSVTLGRRNNRSTYYRQHESRWGALIPCRMVRPTSWDSSGISLAILFSRWIAGNGRMMIRRKTRMMDDVRRWTRKLTSLFWSALSFLELLPSISLWGHVSRCMLYWIDILQNVHLLSFYADHGSSAKTYLFIMIAVDILVKSISSMSQTSTRAMFWKIAVETVWFSSSRVDTVTLGKF